MFNNPQNFLTISLSEYVRFHLGDGYWHHRRISKSLAHTIFLMTNNEHTCYIQFTSREGESLEFPILWDFGAWKSDSERWLIASRYSHKQRVERFLREDNARNVAKAFAQFASVDIEYALVMAYTLLDKKQISKIRVFYDGLIKTKEEEL